MRNFLLVFLLLSLISCKSYFINYAFEERGIYDEKISLENLSFKDKEIIFFPMHHLGRHEFYDDVGEKIDSLKNEGYVFFYENIKGTSTDTIDYYKFRKIMNIALPVDGYTKVIEGKNSLKKVRFKFDLINQPSIKDFGLTEENSFHIDVEVINIINNVEKVKEIVLEDCDLKNHFTEEYLCKKKFLTKEESNKFIVDDRNEFLVEEIKKSKYSKIAIIYGKGHLEGVKELLAEE